MPVIKHVPEGTAEATLQGLERNLRAFLGKALKDQPERPLRIDIERRRQGSPSGAFDSIDIVRELGESDEELAEEGTRLTLESIRADAARPRYRERGPSQPRSHVGPWDGEVSVHHDDPNVKKSELKRFSVHLEDPNEDLRLDNESISLVKTANQFAKDVCREAVGILAAAKEREQALSDLVVGVAKTVRDEQRGSAKYAYKEAKLRAKMEEQRVEEEASVHRSRAWADAAATIAKQYEPVIEIWSRWATEQQRARAEGRPPPESVRAPNADELRACFGVEAFDSVHAIAAQMIAERDPQRRFALSVDLRQAMQSLGDDARRAMQAHSSAAVGETRAREIYTWLAMPISPPT